MDKSHAHSSQYFLCKVCNLSYSERNHVYSKKHRDSLEKILQKFFTKVKEAKALITRPDVRDKNFETGAKWWCYCCDCEVPKHDCQNDVVVCYFGMLHHLQSVGHLKKIKHYWWQNRIKASQIEDYIVPCEDFRKYNVTKAIDDYKANQKMLHQKEVLHIISIEEMRKEMLRDASREESESSINNVKHNSSIQNHSDTTQESSVGKDMTPPWLQKHEDDTTIPKEIGPSLKDLENARKRKLPARRVGADFNRHLPLSSSWLPSFGRVWNNGRRKASKLEFQRSQWKRQPKKPEHISRCDRHPNWTSVPTNINKYIL